MQLNGPEDAIVHYRRALAIRPHLAEAHNNVGTALHALKRPKEAIGFYAKALAMRPDYGDAHANMGTALEVLGRTEQACYAYERAIELAPKRADFYRHLFTSKRATADDPRFSAMEGLAKEIVSLPAGQQIELHFALGKALADLGQHERSFRHLFEGNTLKRQQIVYDEAATLAMFDRIRAKFTPELMRSRGGQGDQSSVPVFILGMPRSGSTLIEQILASHPLVFGGGELSNFVQAVRETVGRCGACGPFPEMGSDIAGPQLGRLGARYMAGIRALAPDAARVTDKMPTNFQLVGLIHLALPNARIIHSVRDPVDTCFSCFSILFATNQPFTYELGELGRYYCAYRRLMEHWRALLPDGVVLELRYEELVADLEGQARRLLAHCGLAWDDACLAFWNTQRPVDTASAAQVRQPIYESSVGRWRRHGRLLDPLLAALGPDCSAHRNG
jgi:Sulfotransferase family/Tetratricopeptide repeat